MEVELRAFAELRVRVAETLGRGALPEPGGEHDRLTLRDRAPVPRAVGSEVHHLPETSQFRGLSGSTSGFSQAGISSIHFWYAASHCGYVEPYGVESGGKT